MDTSVLLLNSPVNEFNGYAEEKLSDDTFIEIYERYCKPVYNFMCYRLNNTHTAEELTNDVFVKIIMKYETYSGEKGKFEVWLFAIARNILNDYFRSNKKINLISYNYEDEIVSSDEFVLSEVNPESISLQNEENIQLMRSLDILHAKERSIISLKFGAQLKNTQIAEITGLSEKNVSVILCRSLKKLRKKLERGAGI